MRWAFWRRARPDREQPPAPASLDPAPETPRTAPASADEPDEDRRATSPFSGASPAPGASDAEVLLPADGEDVAALLAATSDDPSLDAAGVRADVLALVQAALARDRGGAEAVLRRLDARGPDEPGMASVAAMAALGDRCAAAAGFPSGALPSGGAAGAAVVAQGDTLAARAEPLLRSLAPHASRDLVRLVVRFACGVPDQDPAVAHLADAPPEDLALVAAVLLAQSVRDGGAAVDALAGELEDLLPG